MLTTSKLVNRCSACKCNHCRQNFPSICWHISLYCVVLHGISLLVRPVNQQQRQLVVRFYSNKYCATSSVNVLAKRFRLTSNRYIVCESANIKVCQYQAMISNGLFEETNSNIFFLSRLTVYTLQLITF